LCIFPTLVDIIGQHNNRVFDKRYNLQFHFGDGFLCDIPAGVEEGLRHFCIKEKSLLTLHPKFAFGENGNEKFGVPPSATVKYEVCLKSSIPKSLRYKLSYFIRLICTHSADI